MIDLGRLSDGLEYRDGIWFGRGSETLSYPAGGNQECLAIEDGSYWFAHRNRCLIQVLRRFPAGEPLLDIGAGNGFVARALEDAGVATIALEPGPEGARAARDRGLPAVVCASLEGAGFRADALPAAGLFDVLEHVEDHGGFLVAIRRLLRPGGRLFVSVPALPALWSAEDRYAGHFRRYRERDLRQVLAASGFTVEWTSYLFAPLVPAVFLLRALPSRFGLRRVQAERLARQHRAGSSPLGAGLARLLAREEQRLAAGGRVAVGTSCLAVAQRPLR